KKPLQAVILWCLAPWAKSEGLVWAGVTTIGIFFSYPTIRKYVLLTAPLLAAPWSLFTKYMGLSSSQYFRFNELYARPWIEYATYSIHSFREEFRNVEKWNLTFYLFFGALVFRIRQVFSDKALFIPVVAFFIQLVSYMVIFTITPEEQATFIAAAVSRLTLHLAPAAICIVVYMISSTDKELVHGAKIKKR
ncbi:MAG TPA: hypothetical protein VJ246_01345, partial [Patescibacteria group bacterium]|nr:hypothetical protein [Patescibacteria group bacterium]